MRSDFCADVKEEAATAEGGNLGHLAAGRATETRHPVQLSSEDGFAFAPATSLTDDLVWLRKYEMGRPSQERAGPLAGSAAPNRISAVSEKTK